MSDPVTGAVAAAAAEVTKRDLLQQFVNHHALYHTIDRGVSGWNIPFLHVPWLDYFRLDQVMVPFSALVVIALALIARRGRGPVPKGMANVLEAFVKFIRDQICVTFLGPADGVRLTPFFCSLFMFILAMNLLGVIPLFVVATSNISVTGALALVILGLMTVGTIARNGFVNFLKVFVMPGVPWPMQFLLVPMEFISMFTKCMALMIRLAANMLAGHILLFTMVGMVFLFGWIALPAVAIAVALFFFELFVIFFQAYIFTLLSAIFVGQMFHPAHE